MGAGTSVPTKMKQPAGVLSANEQAEQTALETLKRIEDGSQCLAGGMHVWQQHEGQHGTGQACARCFMAQHKKGEIFFKIHPVCEQSAEPATATSVLELWRAELERVSSGGCVAGGEHDWVDVNKTLVRLHGDGRCCQRCGVVEGFTAESDGFTSKSNLVLCLPNLIGMFGPPQGEMYRKMYGGPDESRTVELEVNRASRRQREV